MPGHHLLQTRFHAAADASDFCWSVVTVTGQLGTGLGFMSILILTRSLPKSLSTLLQPFPSLSAFPLPHHLTTSNPPNFDKPSHDILLFVGSRVQVSCVRPLSSRSSVVPLPRSLAPFTLGASGWTKAQKALSSSQLLAQPRILHFPTASLSFSGEPWSLLFFFCFPSLSSPTIRSLVRRDGVWTRRLDCNASTVGPWITSIGTTRSRLPRFFPYSLGRRHCTLATPQTHLPKADGYLGDRLPRDACDLGSTHLIAAKPRHFVPWPSRHSCSELTCWFGTSR